MLLYVKWLKKKYLQAPGGPSQILKKMDFDDMLEELGELGKFQVLTYTLVCLPVLFAAAGSLSYVFTAGIPNYRCYIPECEDPIDNSYNEPWVKWAVPKTKTESVLEVADTYCYKYVVNSTYKPESLICSPNIFTKTIEKCNQFVFENEERTIVNDWNITCLDNQWKLSLIGTSHFAGIVVGSAVFGVLADRYGRKMMLLFCIGLMSISGMAQVVCPDYTSFTIMIFINACGLSGVYPLAFIIGVEMVGKRKRDVTAIVLNYFYAIGEALVALIAWLTKDWVWLQMIVSAPALLFIAYYWLVPESVRWLLANEKNEKAKKIVCRVAKFNNVELSENLLESFKEHSPLCTKEEPKEETKMWPVVKEMFNSRIMIIRFVILYFIWAIMAFVFYGLSVNSTSLGGDKYLNFALVSLIEIPGYSLAWVCINKLGRRWSLIASLLLCGLTCTAMIFIPTKWTWAVITLFLVGKLGVTASFGVAYVYTAEMFPTVIRSGAVGSSSTVARLGALLAPFVPLLGTYYKPLPMLLFGATSILAAGLALKLPETHGTKLPETVEEAKRLK